MTTARRLTEFNRSKNISLSPFAERLLVNIAALINIEIGCVPTFVDTLE
jgi:hypothetical protein